MSTSAVAYCWTTATTRPATSRLRRAAMAGSSADGMRRLCLRAGWESYGYRAAPLDAAVEAHRAAMGLHDRGDDRQPQPAAPACPATGLVGAPEPLEHVRRLVGRQSGTSVRDAKYQLLAFELAAHVDRPTVGRVHGGVRDQVAQHAQQLVAVRVDGERRRCLGIEPALRVGRPCALDGILDQLADVDRFE